MKFEVQGMTCGGCAAAVRRSVQRIDPTALVDVDLAGKSVTVSATVAANAAASAIGSAGFPARLLEA